jgi:hypothetical protein
MSNFKAKFPERIMVCDTEESGLEIQCRSTGACVPADIKHVGELEGLEDGDAVAVYVLDHVYSYETAPRLVK